MKKIALFLLVSLVFFASCKKTVESEKKSWDINLREANELKIEYPSFANVINDQVKIADTAMNEALALIDEKIKIQKMTDANGLLNVTFIRNLKEIKTLKYSVRTKSTELRSLKLDISEMMTSNRVIAEAERSANDANSKLQVTVNSRADADSVTGFVLSDLKSNVSLMDRMISNAKEKENLEKKKVEQAAAIEKQKTEAAQPIKCTYCGVLNVPTAVNCKGCGAPLKK